MQIVVKARIKGVREKKRIRELILGAIRGITLSSIHFDNVVFTFPERYTAQNRTKIQLITDFRCGEVIGAEEEAQIKTAICLALTALQGTGEVEVTIRGFDVAFDEYC